MIAPPGVTVPCSYDDQRDADVPIRGANSRRLMPSDLRTSRIQAPYRRAVARSASARARRSVSANISSNEPSSPHDAIVSTAWRTDPRVARAGAAVVDRRGHGRGCHGSDAIRQGCDVEVVAGLVPGDGEPRRDAEDLVARGHDEVVPVDGDVLDLEGSGSDELADTRLDAAQFAEDDRAGLRPHHGPRGAPRDRPMRRAGATPRSR